MTEWAHATLVLPMAMAPIGSVPWLEAAPPAVSDRCRQTLIRMSRNLDSDVYDAMVMMTEAMGQLEREVRVLRHQQKLATIGVEMKPELVSIAADGIALQRAVTYPEGEELQVHLDLHVWGTQRLMVLRGRVEHTDGASRLAFVEPTGEQRDTLVALVFQEQGRRRRNAATAD